MSTPVKKHSKALLVSSFAAVALVVGTVGATSAAYLDTANINIGSDGVIGNPNEFEVQVREDAGDWQDADTAAEAVVYPLVPTGTVSTVDPVEFVATMRLAPDSPSGDVVPSLFAVDGCVDKCASIFETMLFDISIDGTEIAQKMTAAEFNAFDGRVISDVEPEEEHQIKIVALLAPDTPFFWSGEETEIGLVFEGESN